MEEMLKKIDFMEIRLWPLRVSALLPDTKLAV